MKKIVITSGGTQEPIDKVRSITNKSSGKLGAKIAEQFLALNEELEVIYIHGKGAVKPTINTLDEPRIKYIEITSTENLEYQITRILTEEKIDIFVHSMAVADYSVDKVINLQSLKENLIRELSLDIRETSVKDFLFKTRDNQFEPEEFDKIFNACMEKSMLDTSSKMSSSNFENAVILKRNKKLISLVKKLSPFTFLVGLKLLNDVNENILFDVGFELLRENRCNLVFANDLSHIKAGNHDGLLIFPEKNSEYLKGKDEISYYIAKESLKRSSIYHPKSVKIGDNPVIPEHIFNNLRSTGCSLYAAYLLPEVSNYDKNNVSSEPTVGTYGNMSIYEDDNIYMTGRNVHKGELQPEDLALIVGVKEEKKDSNLEKIYSKVKYLGHKPSIDATIHASIYKETECKAILHIHTSKVFLGHPMIAESFPCGSDAERDAIVNVIKNNPGEKIIQMYKHGLIVLGESLEDCYVRLNELMFEGLYVDYENHTWDDEALAHVKEVNGRELIDDNHIYALYSNGELIGNIFEKKETDIDIPEIKILNFAIITGEKAKKKGLGIIRKYLDLWQNSYEMRLHTTEDCQIKDLYIEKYGFIPMRNYVSLNEDEKHIVLVKTPFPLVLGLSGYSGAGKSNISDALMDYYDYIVIDCDSISKRLMITTEVIEELQQAFGDEIIIFGETATPTKQINRRKLAEIVFNSEENRQKLNAIMYPKITENIKEQLTRLKGNKIILDAPTIYEVPEIMELCDKFLMVKAPEELLIQRIMRRDSISEESAKARLASQKGLLEYEKIADIIINNDANVPSFEIEEWKEKIARTTVRKIFE